MPDLSGKVAIITGASSGIGAATAEHFASLGALLVLAGRNVSRLDQVRARCQAAGDGQQRVVCLPGDGQQRVVCLPGDVCSEPYCRQLVDTAVTQFGKLDILVNSAGSLVTGTIETVTLQQHDQQMEINARSALCLSQLAVPHLLKSRGNIVNVSSINGIRSFPGVLAYCMSKGAVDQLTRCTAIELAGRGVRVNSVNPGVIITEVHKTAGMDEAKYQAFLEHSKTTHALGRPGNVMEVARPIAFLASDDASFITGVTLPVDGGRGVLCPR